MKLAIMQPYFLPYIGYWQLLNAVDKYIVYDNIEYTKGWINRNRFLQNRKKAAYFTIPLEKDSDYLNICERKVSNSFDKQKMIRQLENSYHNAPLFDEAISVFRNIINFNKENLFSFLMHSIRNICSYLNIDYSKVEISSHIPINHSLTSEDKVLALCKAVNANKYINAIGGIELYDRDRFNDKNIELKFLKSRTIRYKQFEHEFVPSLSIIDVMMFNSVEEIQDMLLEYHLI